MITQGKWVRDGFYVCRIDSKTPGATYICEMDRAGMSDKDALDNARLIAAAPDLLTACEAQDKADNWFGASDTGRKLKDNAKELRVAAIKKATE